jgi:dTMP kinase
MLYNDHKHLENESLAQPGRGRLITFEGIDGCGKSTQAVLAARFLQEQGLTVLSVREPGGTTIGEAIRSILLEKANTAMCMETELLLFAAARAQIIREAIEPALGRGTWVICDRFYDSTTAYQGYGRGLDRAMIRQLQAIATGGLQPDRTFFLDVTLPVALGRLSSRTGKTDRLDQEGAAFMARTKEGYLDILRDEPDRVVRIDADQTIQEISTQIIRQLKGDLSL